LLLVRVPAFARGDARGSVGEVPSDDTASAPLVAVVEIPKGVRNKYEYDPALGGIKFDRLLMTAATYPADYGYFPETLGKDGDPLDALVCLTEPTFPGCLIPVKPVGMFKMRDEKGVDDKIICVPLGDPNWNRYDRVEELPELLRQEIEQFFSIYKDLEHKEVVVGGWCSYEDALEEIAAAQDRFAREVQRGEAGEYRAPGGRVPGPGPRRSR
jgi:inorganic pyrophosphatase